MNRVIERGQVAVLISREFGTGWFSWHGVDDLIFDPVIVEMVRNDRHDEIKDYVFRAYPDVDIDGCDISSLGVEMVPIGSEFRINECGGAESIVFPEDDYWILA
jgi:hypothetical protein